MMICLIEPTRNAGTYMNNVFYWALAIFVGVSVIPMVFTLLCIVVVAVVAWIVELFKD